MAVLWAKLMKRRHHVHGSRDTHRGACRIPTVVHVGYPPWCTYPAWYRAYIPSMVQAYIPSMDHGGHIPSMAHGCYIPSMAGGTIPSMAGGNIPSMVHSGIYTTWYTPWYTPPSRVHLPHRLSVLRVLTVHAVPDNSALGSNPGIIRRNEAHRAFQPPKV